MYIRSYKISRCFVIEQALLAELHSALEAKLTGANESRTFYTQSVLPGVHFNSSSSSNCTTAPKSTQQQHKSSVNNTEASQTAGSKRKRPVSQDSSGDLNDLLLEAEAAGSDVSGTRIKSL